jgi:hypothetical protein
LPDGWIAGRVDNRHHHDLIRLDPKVNRVREAMDQRLAQILVHRRVSFGLVSDILEHLIDFLNEVGAQARSLLVVPVRRVVEFALGNAAEGD